MAGKRQTLMRNIQRQNCNSFSPNLLCFLHIFFPLPLLFPVLKSGEGEGSSIILFESVRLLFPAPAVHCCSHSRVVKSQWDKEGGAVLQRAQARVSALPELNLCGERAWWVLRFQRYHLTIKSLKRQQGFLQKHMPPHLNPPLEQSQKSYNFSPPTLMDNSRTQNKGCHSRCPIQRFPPAQGPVGPWPWPQAFFCKHLWLLA